MGDSILDDVVHISNDKELFKIDGINYNFLCVSTDEMLKTRSIEDIDTLPICPTSWSKDTVETLAKIEICQRDSIKGCLLSKIGSSADIHLCSKDKNTVLKVFRPRLNSLSQNEYHFMQQTKGCLHLLQCNEQYTDLSNNIIGIEQSTPVVDLLCSHYYELSFKGLIRLVIDIAKGWDECKQRGVLYRDIHVCNIYRSKDGTFKLGDFGSCTNKSDIKELVGSQWFMAPETCKDGIFTEASAVYSISMIMYFILNNLRPAFWASDCNEHIAWLKRMSYSDLPMPSICYNLPSHVTENLVQFFRNTTSAPLKRRIFSIEELIYGLNMLTHCCGEADYIVHHKGYSLDFDLFERNYNGQNKYDNYILCNDNHQHTMSEEVERFAVTMCGCSATIDSLAPYDFTDNPDLHEDPVDSYIESTATIDSFDPCDFTDNPDLYEDTEDLDIESFFIIDSFDSNNFTCNYNNNLKAKMSQAQTCEKQIIELTHQKNKLENRLSILEEQNKYDDVYSSIFAPAEVKRKSHMLVQVYLHLYEEAEKVKSLAKESDKNAERRDHIPLSLKLKKGDKVDIEFNVYGETRLVSEHKSIIWHGSSTKCSFNYFVPNDINVDDLCCEANLFVNGAMIGEMRFITRIVDAPRNLNADILSHRFNKIFISYAHQDAQQVKLLALAYKAQGVDYFYDRDSLAPGDVYEERIFDYIDSSDLFVLCWSKNASVSDYVSKEKGRALLRAYPQLSQKDATLKICPISIEPRADLPNDMKDVYNFEIM